MGVATPKNLATILVTLSGASTAARSEKIDWKRPEFHLEKRRNGKYSEHALVAPSFADFRGERSL
jgi:hypothetical protein